MIQKLKILREQAKLSQGEVAQKLEVSRPTYVRIEQGESEPTLSQMKRLAEILGVSPESFLCEESAMKTADFEDEKYKQVLLNCIKYGADDDGKITKTKLAKLAYLLDFAWFYKNLKPLTGLQYRRMAQGPVPDAFFRSIDELFENGTIAIEFKGAAQMISANEDVSVLEKGITDLLQKVCKRNCRFYTQATSVVYLSTGRSYSI
jgi:transcriptional regulator with XRE-family HTH domain